MYRLDWIEQLKLKLTAAPSARNIVQMSPIVWSLGFTSLLTDISTEMLNSALPVYLVLHLHLSPVQFGVIDGVYNGLAVALLGVLAGLIADKWARHKEVAGFGYLISGVCKLLLLATGGAWTLITLVVGLDRAGKGIRAAPRDALLSFNSPRHAVASAFALHRGLDAGGALLGPVVAFILLAQVPGDFDVLWLTSFVFAVLGFAVLALFVPGSRSTQAVEARVRSASEAEKAPGAEHGTTREAFKLLSTARFGAISACALLLAVFTVSDAFIYLVLQERTGTPSNYIPLFYVGTACFYMLFSLPAGALADKFGHRRVLLGGYVVLLLVYVLLLSVPSVGWAAVVLCLALMGIYYAASEGILMALASTVIPARLRTSGLALIVTAIGIGKMFSSVIFGWVWSSNDRTTAIGAFIVGLVIAVVGASKLLSAVRQERGADVA